MIEMDARVDTVIKIMNDSITDELSVSTLSRAVNLSPTRLRQLFNKEIGCPPMQYLRRLRMQRACELLSTTFLSIKEITGRCGVGDMSHFERDFKKHCGLTPSEFRQLRDKCAKKV